MNSIAANNNVGNGAILDNDDLSPGLANVTLTGTNSFKENRLGGLTISSDGMVTISNVTANDNGIVNSSGYGVNVDNSGASTPKAVTLTGTNQLNGNYSGGLKVISKGTITISNLTASFNFNKGVSLDNIASGTALPQNVTITGTSNTNNNTSAGLDVGTYGTISIGSITANGNGGSGVSLNNSGGTTPKAVTLTGYVHAYGNGDGNDYGLYIHSLGAIKINALDASYNNGSGAWLDNNDAGAVSGITLSGSNDFNFNTGYGLLGESRGVILINDLDASGNTAGFGADLDNYVRLGDFHCSH